MTTEDKIVKLEKEIKELSIKLEALVNYLNAERRFGPPDGRRPYDAMVRSELASNELEE
jgi:hypothetical protein